MKDDEEAIKVEDYVKIVKGSFLGYYACVIGDSYGDEIEIQYFEKKYDTSGKFLLKDNDFDSRECNELVKVSVKEIDGQQKFTFAS